MLPTERSVAMNRNTFQEWRKLEKLAYVPEDADDALRLAVKHGLVKLAGFIRANRQLFTQGLRYGFHNREDLQREIVANAVEPPKDPYRHGWWVRMRGSEYRNPYDGAKGRAFLHGYTDADRKVQGR